jgi:hypothetical protein
MPVQWHICIFFLQEAFDGVPWSELWELLWKRRVEENLITAIQSFYKNQSTYIPTSNMNSTDFDFIVLSSARLYFKPI